MKKKVKKKRREKSWTVTARSAAVGPAYRCPRVRSCVRRPPRLDPPIIGAGSSRAHERVDFQSASAALAASPVENANQKKINPNSIFLIFSSFIFFFFLFFLLFSFRWSKTTHTTHSRKKKENSKKRSGKKAMKKKEKKKRKEKRSAKVREKK